MKPQPSMRAKNRAFTGWDLLIVIVVVVVLAGLLLPALFKAKPRAARISCVSNLKQVGLAFRMWSNDSKENFPWMMSTNQGGTMEYANTSDPLPHFRIASNELSTPKVLVCPDDNGKRKISDWSQFTNTSHLSYFVGLDADETKAQTVLSGDRNISTNGTAAKGLVSLSASHTMGWAPGIHPGYGNIGFGDGSAAQITSQGLNGLRPKDTNSVARLVIP